MKIDSSETNYMKNWKVLIVVSFISNWITDQEWDSIAVPANPGAGIVGELYALKRILPFAS